MDRVITQSLQQQQAHFLGFYHSSSRRFTQVHPRLDDSRAMNACCSGWQTMDIGRHCTAWDRNVTPAVRGKTVSTVTAVSAYIVHVPRMTAEWLHADERRKMHWTQLSGPRTSNAHNWIMHISDMHLSRVGSHSKSLDSNGTNRTTPSLCS